MKTPQHPEFWKSGWRRAASARVWSKKLGPCFPASLEIIARWNGYCHTRLARL